jgi:hypothetical protein
MPDLELRATVIAPTRFMPGHGIAQLDKPYQGLIYVAIDLDTIGKHTLEIDTNGYLIKGSKLRVQEARMGSEALSALRVEPVK